MRLGGLLHSLRRIEDTLLVVILLLMLALAVAQILLRNLLDTGLIWSEPLLKAMVLWVALLGAMVATRERHHINIDLLSRLLGPRARRLQHHVIFGISGLVCLLLAYESGRFVVEEWEAGTRAFATVPSWLVEVILPVGFASMGLRFLLQALDHSEVEPS